MIASDILIQAAAGTAAVMTAALGDRPGVWGAASAAGRCDVTARAGTRNTGELAGMVTSRARSPVPGRG